MPETKKDGKKTAVKTVEPRNPTVKTQLANVKVELEQVKKAVAILNTENADLKRQLKEANDALISDLTPELDMKLTELSGGKLDAVFLASQTPEEKQKLVEMMSLVVDTQAKTPPFRTLRAGSTNVEVPRGPLQNLYLKTDKDLRKQGD